MIYNNMQKVCLYNIIMSNLLKIRQKKRVIIFRNLLCMIYLNLFLDKDHILTKIL